MAVYKFAGFWRRLISITIDCFIINVIFTTLLTVVSIALFAGAMSGSGRAWVADLLNPGIWSFSFLMASGFYLALYLFYFTYFHGAGGRTPGKMMLGLQVLSTDGMPITFGIAFLRSVGYLVSGIFCLGFIWAAFDRRKQGWHDKIAQTVVIIRPGENYAVGLTIPAPGLAPIAEGTGEKQNEANGEPATQSIIPEDIIPGGNAGHEPARDHKIP
jgi:uncharacterized RDD family membrane protein YckC